MDPNRDLEEGAQDSKTAQKAHKQFHNNIKSAYKSIKNNDNYKKYKNHAVGLHLDFHGYTQDAEDWTQLGYLFTKPELRDKDLDSSKSSIRGLLRREAGTNKKNTTALIYGDDSFGGMFYIKNKYVARPYGTK